MNNRLKKIGIFVISFVVIFSLWHLMKYRRNRDDTEMKFKINYEDSPFLKTSETAAFAERLNMRAEILLTRNKEAIKGKRILDLGSHDGRFSYACLKLGASHVIGIEFRPHLVENARTNLLKLGFDSQEFSFIQDDVFNYLPKVKQGEFDTILCFGFFYHTVRQIELLREIHRIRPKYFILDTMVNTGLNEPCLVFKYESSIGEGGTIDPLELVALPTKSFIELYFKRIGYTYREIVWGKERIKNLKTLKDYKIGKRLSYFVQLY